MPDEEIAKWKAKGKIEFYESPEYVCRNNGFYLQADVQGWQDLYEIFNKILNSPYSSCAKIDLCLDRFNKIKFLEIKCSIKTPREFFWDISVTNQKAVIFIGIAGINEFLESIKFLQTGQNDFTIGFFNKDPKQKITLI